jgi:hypothetical protein
LIQNNNYALRPPTSPTSVRCPIALCGLAAARGEAAIVLAADGQDPAGGNPTAHRGVAQRRRRGVGGGARTRRSVARSRVASRAFHGLLRQLSGLETLTSAGSDFFLVSRPVIQVVNALGERNTNVMALLAWIGFDQVAVANGKDARAVGNSGWTVAKKVKRSSIR